MHARSLAFLSMRARVFGLHTVRCDSLP